LKNEEIQQVLVVKRRACPKRHSQLLFFVFLSNYSSADNISINKVTLFHRK
ncbi:hypothetical protein Bpfe_025564, partial [Biomphalaria pfeifferi]